MMNIEPDASHSPDVLRDVLGEIETLRNMRQEEVRDRPHPFLKLNLTRFWRFEGAKCIAESE